MLKCNIMHNAVIIELTHNIKVGISYLYCQISSSFVLKSCVKTVNESQWKYYIILTHNRAEQTVTHENGTGT